jgi:hypothetical protein
MIDINDNDKMIMKGYDFIGSSYKNSLLSGSRYSYKTLVVRSRGVKFEKIIELSPYCDESWL